MVGEQTDTATGQAANKRSPCYAENENKNVADSQSVLTAWKVVELPTHQNQTA